MPPCTVFARKEQVGICSMNRLLTRLAIAGTVGGLLATYPTAAQILHPASKTAHVEIIKGPELESARDDVAIIRWTTTNPGGNDAHFAVAHYGTDPNDLSQVAKSPIRLNRGHAETIFRVRVDHLTDTELEELAAKYEAEGDALHAAELRRFRRL